MQKTIAICLPLDVLYNVDRYCKEIACSRSSFISQAISLYTNLLPKGQALPPPTRRDLGDLKTRMLDRIDANMGSITKTDLSKPFNSSSTAKERNAVIDELVKEGKVRLRDVPRGVGRPVTLVELVPGEGECDPPAAWWPPQPVTPEDRIRSALKGRGPTPLARLRERIGRHLTALEADNAMVRMSNAGELRVERSPKGIRPGRPITWITLLPAKAPVEPVDASAAQNASTIAATAAGAHAPDKASVDAVAAHAAGQGVP